MKSPTNKQIAKSWKLWQEYADIDGDDSKQEFNKMTQNEKVEILNDMFGFEEDEEEEMYEDVPGLRMVKYY